MGPWLKACRGCRRPCATVRRCSKPVLPAACSSWPRRSGTGGCCQAGSLEAVGGKGGRVEGNGTDLSKRDGGPWKAWGTR